MIDSHVIELPRYQLEVVSNFSFVFGSLLFCFILWFSVVSRSEFYFLFTILFMEMLVLELCMNF